MRETARTMEEDQEGKSTSARNKGPSFLPCCICRHLSVLSYHHLESLTVIFCSRHFLDIFIIFAQTYWLLAAARSMPFSLPL
ncbi:uncharacterized protein CLUP02_11887 [Colletotrichum lupini]|uniref:Uncharacterized protein n=1 Tax=Colletotrichum lupini TaxID=145971 RepID=A0A9Q8SZG0_9PEZI|nr:uncharacterized protein CLUP02_11887 [Colletotrichum lupini]UQC86386.1 hypothetical protein CLUP02_11887 [Colletotrichum lupini]